MKHVKEAESLCSPSFQVPTRQHSSTFGSGAADGTAPAPVPGAEGRREKKVWCSGKKEAESEFIFGAAEEQKTKK